MMRNCNWLIKTVFYLHHETSAVEENTNGDNSIFYDVAFVSQEHANLCVDACENMINHFMGKPVASMHENPRGPFMGSNPSSETFINHNCQTENFHTILQEKGPFLLKLPLRYGMAHAVIVVGCVDDKIIYHDPLTQANRLISYQDLNNLNAHTNSTTHSILYMRNPPDLKRKKIKALNLTPEHFHIDTYQSHFNLEQMQDPCNAIRSCLHDYAYARGPFVTRHHANAVKAFLKAHKNEQNLDVLLKNMDKFLGHDARKTQGELMARLATIHKVMQSEETASTSCPNDSPDENKYKACIQVLNAAVDKLLLKPVFNDKTSPEHKALLSFQANTSQLLSDMFDESGELKPEYTKANVETMYQKEVKTLLRQLNNQALKNMAYDCLMAACGVILSVLATVTIVPLCMSSSRAYIGSFFSMPKASAADDTFKTTVDESMTALNQALYETNISA